MAAGVLSAAAYGAMSFVVHSYGGKLPATEVIFFRSVFALVVLWPFAFRDRRELLSRSANLLWLRSLLGAVSILSFTWNLQHTSIGLASVLFNVAPLGVMLFAWVSKSERLTLARIVCLVLVVAGGFVFWGDVNVGAVGQVFAVGLGGALAAAGSYTVLNRAAANWSPFTLTWGISVLSIPVTLLLKRGPWVPLYSGVILPVLSIAVLCSAGQVFVALSYRWAELSTATALASSSMAWGVVLDVFSGSTAGLKQLIGCAIYLAGCIPLTVIKAPQSAEVPQDVMLSSDPNTSPKLESQGACGSNTLQSSREYSRTITDLKETQMSQLDQNSTVVPWKTMCFQGTSNCPIEEVRELRRFCWPKIYAAGYSLEDGFDDEAWHWTIRLDDRLAAAARLTIHQNLVQVPAPHLFVHLSSCRLPTPIGYISRLVVHPEARGRGLASILDKTRLDACNSLRARSLVVVWSASSGIRRKRQFMDLGFQSADGDAAQPDGVFGTASVYWMLIANNSALD